MLKKSLWLAISLIIFSSTALYPSQVVVDLHLRGSYRAPIQNGWIFIHLEGAPDKIGFQHGYLLADEIVRAQKCIRLEMTRETGRDWNFFKEAAKTVFWPKVDKEYQDELLGIVEGLNTRGIKVGLADIVAMNAWMELSPYYLRWTEQNHSASPLHARVPAERCSAFVATGKYTKDGKVIIGHNAWTAYLNGQHWNIIFDVVPVKGYRFLMDGFPGLIHSGDDFGINSAGLMITETTISRFSGFDPKGIPEFVRARKAMQYAATIEEFAKIMKEGNNGGYANNWLVADRKTNEIASLELGLKNVHLWRKKDGYFSGANFPVDENLIREETSFDPANKAESANARRIRWDQLMRQNKGKIDISAGKIFLADHFDTFSQKIDPDERTLCAHNDLSPRGMRPWMAEFAPGGTVQAKICDASLAEKMSFWAALGHPCGMDFKVDAHLQKYSQFRWQQELLGNLDAHPWSLFSFFDNTSGAAR